MPSPLAHPAAAFALAAAFPGLPRWAVPLGVAFTLAPDVDTIAFLLGAPYDSTCGHRGVTHSIVFAALSAAVGVGVLARFGRAGRAPGRLGTYLFLAMASHGLLDAMTNTGLGVAFFVPFDSTRYFLPFRPIDASPISDWYIVGWRGVPVLVSELKWIWLPAGVFAIAALAVRRCLRRPSA